jgi:TonB family protein
VRRNRGMPGLAERLRDSTDAPDIAHAVDVVVLSTDVVLFQAIRDAVGQRSPVWRARDPAESVDLLVTGRCGVLLIDMGAVPAQPALLIQQITSQFPDVVIVVTGRRDDESLLASLISEGLVYRFMHKPLSPKRTGMFLNAATRCHVERRSDRPATPLLPGEDKSQARTDGRRWLFAGGGLLLFVALLGVVAVTHYADPREPEVLPPKPAAGISQREPAAPLADPVLSAARAAFAAGRYESPPDRNALDLYAEVLRDRPDNAEARRGLDDTTRRVLVDAEAAAAAGDHVEAIRVVERVLAVEPQNLWALALQARLSPPVEVMVPAPPPRIEPSTPVSGAPKVAATRAQVPVDPLWQRNPGSQAIPGMSSGRPIHTRRYGAPPGSRQPTTSRTAAGPAQTPPIARTAEPARAPANSPPAALPSRELEAVSTPDPRYPPDALRNRIEGWAEVDYTVDENGATSDVAVVASSPKGVFEAVAMEAVASWRYRPRVVNGRPVRERASVTLRFTVAD